MSPQLKTLSTSFGGKFPYRKRHITKLKVMSKRHQKTARRTLGFLPRKASKKSSPDTKKRGSGPGFEFLLNENSRKVTAI